MVSMLRLNGALQHTSIDVYSYVDCRIRMGWFSGVLASGRPSAHIRGRVHYFASHTAQYFRRGGFGTSLQMAMVDERPGGNPMQGIEEAGDLPRSA
jgi:hypothetical protein